ncbi:Hypothetical protein GSB_150429 [Giardia duodenalis]|uniref:Uncharacterized protein n=2 Tax=Giardia intestinalis TaxID=5741 RepID=C6LVS2_GIAIB|nr:Hypothetical protein GL50581_2880 [Giardia intestinalis ATCC 50581]ESU44110.1 Hypothetical protein GSB_150429 [Giardia intestinalis]
MRLQTCLASGSTTLENLRGKSSILLATSNGVALLGISMSLFEARWASDKREVTLLPRNTVLGHCKVDTAVAAVVPTLTVEAVPSKDGGLSPLQMLQNLSETSSTDTESIKLIENTSHTAREACLSMVITGPPILPVIGCVLQHNKHSWVALYRKGFQCLHLFRYSKGTISDNCNDSNPLIPLDPPVLTLSAPIHGVAPLHDHGAFIIATCERSSSTLYMKPNTPFEVQLHSYLLNESKDERMQLKSPSTTISSTINSFAVDHAQQAFSLITQFAADPQLSAQEKASLITAMTGVYDSALKAIYANVRPVNNQL